MDHLKLGNVNGSHLLLAVLSSLLLLYFVSSSSNSAVKAFGQKWQLDRKLAKQLYAYKTSMFSRIMKWLIFGPITIYVGILTSTVFTRDRDILMNVQPLMFYIGPLTFAILGVYFLLMPAEEQAYMCRCRVLRPEDLPKDYTTADLQGALLAAPSVPMRQIRIMGWVSFGLAVAMSVAILHWPWLLTINLK